MDFSIFAKNFRGHFSERGFRQGPKYGILLPVEQKRARCGGVKREKESLAERTVSRGTVEGVILVNGRPQIERSDMPLSLSFNSIEELKRFCEAAKSKYQDQH